MFKNTVQYIEKIAKLFIWDEYIVVSNLFVNLIYYFIPISMDNFSNKYQYVCKIEEGSYGVVWKANTSNN